MGKAIGRLQQRKKALDTVFDLMTHAERVVVIHYSCESFYDRPDGSSPRITSIAIRNLATGQTTSFSIHQMAEIQKVSRDENEQNYDCLEKLMCGIVPDHHFPETLLTNDTSTGIPGFNFPSILSTDNSIA